MMWSPLVLLLLAGAVTADQHYGWKSGSEYQYNVQGRTLAALHQVADQYAGILMKARLTIQPKDDNTLKAKIWKARYAQIHTQLPGGWDSQIPEKKLDYQEFPISSKPFEIKMKNGVVDDLIVNKDVPTWEVNVLKSIVSQLQVDTQGENLIKSKYNQEPEEDQPNAVFKTMEDSVSGECEVLYDISRLPEFILQSKPELVPIPKLRGDGDIIDIVKTKNFSNCDQRMGYHFGISGMTDWEPGTNDNGRFLAKSSVSRIIVSGSLKRFTIQSSVTTNKVILSPHLHDSQNGMVVSRVNLTLEDVKSVSDALPSPSNAESTGNLVYSFNNAFSGNEKRRPNYNNDDSSSSSSSSSNSNSDSSSSSSSSSSSEEDRKRGNNRRSPRAAPSHWEDSSSSSSSSSISSSEEEYLQPRPTLNEAPETPFMPFFIGYKGSAVQQSKELDPVKQIKSLASQIGKELQNPSSIPKQQTLEKFNILTSLVRTMNTRQIADAQQGLYKSASDANPDSENDSIRRNSWVALRDAVAEAGTGPALMSIKAWIETGKIQGAEAAEVITTIARSARTPTPEYMDALFSLITKSEVQKQQYLNSSAILAFTDLVRDAQVSNQSAHNRYPVHAFGRFSPKSNPAARDKYIPYMADQLKKAIRNGDSPKIQLFIRALGNIAHPKILSVFEPYLEGEKEASTFQRLQMVVSMDKLANLYPKLARSVLYKIYQNTGDAHQVRCAAVFQLMKTNPPAAILQRMAEFTNFDHSKHVNGAVKAAIESAAELENYDQRELAHNARAAKDLLNSETYGFQYSQNYLRDYAIQEMNLAYKLAASYIGSEDGIIPRAAFASFKANYGGYNAPASQFNAMVSSIDDLATVFKDQFVQDNDESNERGNARRGSWKSGHGNSGSQWTAKNIAKILNIEAEDAEQLEGNVFINSNSASRFFAFDNHTIEQIPHLLKKAAQALKQGQSFNVTKLHSTEITLGFPTAMGLPFVYSLKMPSLLKIGGEAQIRSKPDLASGSSEEINLPSTVNATTDIHIVYSAQLQGRLGFVAPFEHHTYVAGVQKNLQVNLPIRARVDYDAENQNVRVKLQPIEQNKNYRLLHYSTLPYTAKHNILDLVPITSGNNAHLVQRRKPQSQEIVAGAKTTGVSFRLEAEADENPLQQLYSWSADKVAQHDAISAVAFPWSQQNIHYNNYNLYLDPSGSTSHSAVITASWDSVSKDSKEGSSNKSSPKAQAPQPSSHKPASESRQNELLQKAAEGIHDADASVFNVGVEFPGQNDAQFVVTAAHARSNVDDLQRTVLYAFAKPAEQKKRELCIAAEASAPNVPELNYNAALKANPNTEFDVDIRFGEDCKSGASVNIQGKLKQSKNRREYLQNEPLAKKCQQQMERGFQASPVCQNMTIRANIMDQGRLSLKFNGVSNELKNLTMKVLRHAQAMAYPYAYENMVDPQGQQENEIDIAFNIEPDFTSANLSINAPNLDANFTNVELNNWVVPIVAVHPVMSVAERLGHRAFVGQYAPTCAIDDNYVNTFDNTTYPVELGNCWHVVMTTYPKEDPDNQNGQLDIPEDMKVSILSREIGSNKKEFKIVLGEDEVYLSPAGSSKSSRSSGSSGSSRGEVQVNGNSIKYSQHNSYQQQDENDDDSENAFQIYELPDGSVKLTSEKYDIDATYDGARILIQASNKYRDSIRGLCGNFDGEPATDFTTPQNCVLKKPEEFTATYALVNGEQCEGPAPENANRARQAHCSRQVTLYGNVVSDQEAGRPRKENNNWGNSHYWNRSNKGQNKKEHGKSSHGSSSSKSNGHNQHHSGKSCQTHRTLVIEENHQTCFSLRPVPTCASGCQAVQEKTKTISFHCVPNSGAAQNMAERIRKGANPDFSQKSESKSIEMTVSVTCRA